METESRELMEGVKNSDASKDDGIFLLVDSVNRDNALVIQREGRVIYADTSMGVGVSELVKIRKMKPTHVYRLDEIMNENHVNPYAIHALKEKANSPVPIGIFSKDDNFQFDVGLQNGRIIWANAYYKGNHIVGYTALRLFLSSDVRDVQYHEAMEPSVKIIDLPVEDVLAVFRLPEVKLEKPPAKKTTLSFGRFHRIVNGLSILNTAWTEYLKYFARRKFSGALTSSEGHIVIMREGRVEREDRLDLPYECDFFRVWALEFEGDYSIEGSKIVLGSISLNLPHFLITAEMDGVEGSFFLFAGFEYTPSVNSELFIAWKKAFASFFDNLSIVDFEGMDWIIVNAEKVKDMPPDELIAKYASKFVFVGKPPVENVRKVLPAGSSLSEVLQLLRNMANQDEKKERIDLCFEVKEMVNRLKAQFISWPVEIAKIRTLTGVDPLNLDSCREEDLIKLRDFIKEHYGIQPGGGE